MDANVQRRVCVTLFRIARNHAARAAAWLRGSLWVVPATMTLGAIGLAFLTISLDMRLADDALDSDLWFVFGVGAEGVRGVLSSVAGSIITVTGVVFSINVVALQLASTQYSPRVLRTFLEDRSTHVVLGLFIATFTYSLLVLRTVRGESDSLAEFIPSISVTVAMLLGLASVACLIFFVHHIAQSIRASVIVKRLTVDATSIAQRAFPREHGRPASVAADPPLPDLAGARRFEVRTASAGYLNTVSDDVLFSLDHACPIVVRMRARVGDFLRTGDIVADLETAGDGQDLATRARDAFTLGPEAVGRDDMGLGVTRLAEVAVRALSPGINDPGTASSCLDALSEVLVTIGCRDAPEPVRIGPDDRVRLVARYHTFDDLVELAFGPIRHHGAGQPAVMFRLLTVLQAIAVRLPASRRDVIAQHVVLTRRAVERALAGHEHELERLRTRAVSVLGAIRHDGKSEETAKECAARPG